MRYARVRRNSGYELPFIDRYTPRMDVAAGAWEVQPPENEWRHRGPATAEQ
jgi:hypothetical protein